MKSNNYFVSLLYVSFHTFHKKRVFLSSVLLDEQQEKEAWDYSLCHAQELSGAHRLGAHANLGALQFLKIERYAQLLSQRVCMGDRGCG